MDGERPLTLGASLLAPDDAATQFLSLTRSFVPESAKRAVAGDLYTIDDDASQTVSARARPPPPDQPALPRPSSTPLVSPWSATNSQPPRTSR